MVAILVENLHFISKLEVIFAQKGGGEERIEVIYRISCREKKKNGTLNGEIINIERCVRA